MTAVLVPIVVDDQGVAYVEGTGIKVVEVVRVIRTSGDEPEQARDAFPQLTLDKVYAALSYYYGHKDELDADMARRDRLVEKLREEAEEHPFAQRMRKAGRLP